MSDTTVVIGAGQIGQAIARRVSSGKHVLLADLHQNNAGAAAEVLADAGFDVSTATVDVSSRESVHTLAAVATARGNVTGVIHAAGVSPRKGEADDWQQHQAGRGAGRQIRYPAEFTRRHHHDRRNHQRNHDH
jgi:NAD(P)-dependent dehydrogenase (short-subunit alcohol dehydrogenase family)